MIIKFSKCIDCPPESEDKPLIAKRCHYHYWKHRREINEGKNKNSQLKIKPQKKIASRSKKRQKEDRQYTIKRLRFLAQPGNQRCFIEGCNKRADTVEHTRGRKGYADDWAKENGITLYLDERFWKPCCLDHNLELETNSELSEKYQISKISGKQKIIKR